MTRNPYSEAIKIFKNWLYQPLDEEFPEEYLKYLSENTIITSISKNPHARKICNEYLNSRMNQVPKQELLKFIKHLVRYFCISSADVQPLYKKQPFKKPDTKDWKFIKDYEIPFIMEYLPKRTSKKDKERKKKITLDSILKQFSRIKQTRKECIQCTLRQGIQVLFDTNEPDDITKTKVLFVFEAPGETETQVGKPIVGKAGKVIRPFIYKTFPNIPWFVTNTCLCRPENNRTPNDYELKCCAQNLDDIIKITDPEVIVACGEVAMRRLNVDTSTGVLKHRGHVYDYKLNGKTYKVFCTAHPSYILRNHKTEIYEEDFKKLKELVSGTSGMSEKGKIHSYRIPKEFYNFDLVDIQQTKDTILYIFRDKAGKRTFFKFPANQKYFYYTLNRNDDFIKPVEETYLVKNGFPPSSLDVTLYEEDVYLPLKHVVDFYYTKGEHTNSYQPRVMFLDIEVATKNRIFPDPKKVEFPVSMISLRTPDKKVTLVNSLKFTTNNINNYEIIWCENERDLFKKFIDIIHSSDVDILTAWNVSFDLGYLLNRYEKKLRLSTKNFSPIKQNCYVDLDSNQIKIPGLIVLDLLSAYRSLTYGEQESYSLDFTSEVVLGEKKLEKGSDFGKLFKDDIERAIRYNIDDVEKIYKINKKLGIIEYLNELRVVACVPWADVTTTNKLVEGHILYYSKTKGYVFRNKMEHVKTKYAKVGAYVMSPKPGIHNPIYLVDFKSLYPSIMMSFNIGPDTYFARFANYWEDVKDYFNNIERTYKLILSPHLNPVEKEFRLHELKEFINDKIVTPYGTIFINHNEKTSLMYFVLENLLKQRAHYKKLMKTDKERKVEYDNKQRSYKEIANSNYGYFGFEAARVYNPDIVNSVTITGQFLIKLSGTYGHNLVKNNYPDLLESINLIYNKYWVDVEIEEKKNKDGTITVKHRIKPKDLDYEETIYADTDSLYFKVGNDKESCECEGDRIFDIVNNRLFKEDLASFFKINSDKVHLLLEHEDTCKGYWPSDAKKRYCYLSLISGDIVIKGLEIKRSDYPRITRDRLKELVNIILTEENPVPKIEEVVKSTYQEFLERIRNLDRTLCRPVSFSTEPYKKIPSHVIGMLLWNILIGREDFRPGTKGYQFFIKFNLDSIQDAKLRDSIINMLQECKFKGTINNIVVPEDIPDNEVKKILNPEHDNIFGYTIQIDIERTIDFVWIQRCLNLLKGIMDFSYLFGIEGSKKKKVEQAIASQLSSIFNF